MTAFAAFLGDKVERYIELRRSLSYGFNEQAGTLRALARYVKRSQLDGPATRTMGAGLRPVVRQRRQQSRRSSRRASPILRVSGHLRAPDRGLGAQSLP